MTLDLKNKRYSLKTLEGFVDTFTQSDWNLVTQYQHLSEDFIKKYIDNLDIVFLSCYQRLSEEFIEEYMHILDMELISSCQKLSKTFIEKNIDKLQLQFLRYNFFLTKETEQYVYSLLQDNERAKE